MGRGPVIKRVIDVPMQIHVQQEPDGSWVAVLPAWQLPAGMIAHGDSQLEAVRALKERASKMWGEGDGTSETTRHIRAAQSRSY